MNEHSLKVLEYHEFLELLSGYACSEPGRELLRRLRPATEIGGAGSQKGLYADCLELRRKALSPPPAVFQSPDQWLRLAEPENSVLDPESFLAICDLLQTAKGLLSFLSNERCAEATELQGLGAELDECPELSEAIGRTFEGSEPRVRDNASSRLRSIRDQVSSLGDHIRDTLERLLRNENVSDALQDQFVTTRNGRYVVPVRREMRGIIRGVAHDESNTGRTLFIEPESTIEAGNALEELRLDERHEIRRILVGLTNMVRERSETISHNYELLCRYDAACAVSGWASEYDCHFPSTGDELLLITARHPLLQHQFREEDREAELVPLDLDMPPEKHVVVITGSNTGGKTVMLKTVGLLTLIAQTDLPIPAGDGSSIRPFRKVVADIGDEQSIEQNLSTFSGHLRQIVDILESADAQDTLVLLDELGAGTDPVEGGALGCAILEMLSRARGVTLATTHMGAIKIFVHNHANMENASVAFNVKTLRPEYKLQMGRAGASHALTIAQRSGMPTEALEFAREMMGEDALALETMLSAIDQKQIELEDELDAAVRERDRVSLELEQAAEDRDKAKRHLEHLRRERRKMLHQAQSEADSLVSKTKREMDQVLSEAAKNPDRQRAGKLRKQVASREQRVKKGLRETRDRPQSPLRKEELSVGARVWIENVKDHGTIMSLSDDEARAVVDIGGLSFNVDAGELGQPMSGPSRGTEWKAQVKKRAPIRTVAHELNLVGKRVEPALKELDRFIDDAMAAGMTTVRVVHGYGTGALQRAVHEQLREMPVTGFRLGVKGEDEGGAGVTVVEV